MSYTNPNPSFIQPSTTSTTTPPNPSYKGTTAPPRLNIDGVSILKQNRSFLLGAAALAGGISLWVISKYNRHNYNFESHTSDTIRQGTDEVQRNLDKAAQNVTHTARQVKDQVKDDIHRATR